MAKPAVRRCIQSGFEYGIVILVAKKNLELNTRCLEDLGERLFPTFVK